MRPVGGARHQPIDVRSLVEAKAQAIDDWERGWVEQLLAAHHGNLSRAARAARMGRSHLRQLARRHLPACDPDRDPDP